MKPARNKGFTLVETVIALLTVTIIASVVMAVAVSSAKIDRKAADKLFAGTVADNVLEVFKYTAGTFAAGNGAAASFEDAFITNLKDVYPEVQGKAFTQNTLTLSLNSDYRFIETGDAYLTVTVVCGTLLDNEYEMTLTVSGKAGKELEKINAYRIKSHA